MDDLPLDVDGNPVLPTEVRLAEALRLGLDETSTVFFTDGTEQNGDTPQILFLG